MVMILKDSDEIIGACGFNEQTNPQEGLYEVGYWIDTDHQGNGLVTETVNALTRYALQELKALRVQICTHVENEKSKAVALRSGFILEARRKNDRIDPQTNEVTDGFVFGCCSLLLLPELSVQWGHNKNPKSLRIEEKKLEVLQRSSSKIHTDRLIFITPKKEDLAIAYAVLKESLPEIGPRLSWATNDLSIDEFQVHFKND
jgi:hypothetical protein